jgi:hypothetical protein
LRSFGNSIASDRALQSSKKIPRPNPGDKDITELQYLTLILLSASSPLLAALAAGLLLLLAGFLLATAALLTALTRLLFLLAGLLTAATLLAALARILISHDLVSPAGNSRKGQRSSRRYVPRER